MTARKKIFSVQAGCAALFLALCGFPCGSAQAGYFELSANGSYFKQNYGISGGAPSYTVAKKAGAGFAYRLMSSTSIEFAYSYSNNMDVGAADISTEPVIYYINKTTEVHNYSINLILEFAEKRSTFRPHISGGVGYMIRKVKQTGTAVDRISSASTTLSFTPQADLKSASADGGVGFNIYVTESVAVEAKFTVYATDLDKTEIYLHYAATGGLRFLF